MLIKPFATVQNTGADEPHHLQLSLLSRFKPFIYHERPPTKRMEELPGLNKASLYINNDVASIWTSA
jgi:hypothetical protein